MSKFLKVSDPSRSFYDETNGLAVSNNVIAKVDNLTPLTKTWIMNGGLVEVTEEEYLAFTLGEDQSTPPADQEVESSTQETEEGEKPEEGAGEEESTSEDDTDEEEEEEEETKSGLDALLATPTSKKKKHKHLLTKK